MEAMNNVYPHSYGGAAIDNEASINLDTEMMDEDEIMAIQAADAPQKDEDDEGEIPDTMVNGQHPPPNLMTHKVHLRGLDNMSTGDVKNLVAQNYQENYERLEWIDDTSLNIIFGDETIAREALTAMSVDSAASVPYWELREAKRSESHPLARLEIRIAKDTDKKEKGARERSRYYLFNPEEDRLEQKLKREKERGRNNYRERDYPQRRGSREGSADYNRRFYDAGEDLRRTEKSSYTENMYDDDGDVPKPKEPVELFPGGVKGGRASTSTRSRSPVELFPTKVKNIGVELFPEKTSTSRRRRSASPSEYRIPTPPRKLLSFESVPDPPRRGQSPPGFNIRGRGQSMEDRIELLPNRASSKNNAPIVVSKKVTGDRLGFSNLEYTQPTPEQEDYSMEVEQEPAQNLGFSIRGAAFSKGFSIRGAAAKVATAPTSGDLILDQPRNAGVELLNRPSNAGVELLSAKPAGDLFSRIGGENTQPSRQRNRRKAHDMYS